MDGHEQGSPLNDPFSDLEQALIRGQSKASPLWPVGDADDRRQFAYLAFLAFVTGTVSHDGRQTVQINGHLFRIVYIVVNDDVVDAAKGNINGSAFDQPAIVGVDDCFDDLVFKLALFAVVRHHALRWYGIGRKWAAPVCRKRF